jgi:tubulin--tyrosine ligase-like protein 12
MATKALQKDSDVFLVDHAWSFRFQDAASTLLANEKLLERLEKLACDKLDIPTLQEESKQDAMTRFNQQLAAGGRVFELDELNITSLKDFSWPETLEELSLIGNDVTNPNDVATCIVPLPNIKALWLNANPVAT